jgi:hypothetical protein
MIRDCIGALAIGVLIYSVVFLALLTQQGKVKTMYVARFENGNFVLHKVAMDKGYVSAWYDECGNLTDWEKRHNHCTTSKLAKSDKVKLNALGKMWKGEDND